ncbi:uncharacterized protein LOC114934710 [Nylanderia fulva]|uniref:uncharacterized protein LOC114934710 n=1 Tax=Nylanderia fulva TaxID=613905 RepID=UPI0010FB9F2B|nr:uncharacterized protein LOC114934710 [Nylanderia fulva]
MDGTKSDKPKRHILYYKHMLWVNIYIYVANRLGLHVVTTPSHKDVAIDNGFNPKDIHLVWQSRNCTESTECFMFEWTDDQDNLKISDIKKCQVLSCPNILNSSRNERNLNFLLYPLPYNRINNVLLPFKPMFTSNEAFVHERSPDLIFAIGMIVTHTHKMKDNTRKDITGVIIGWHNKCHKWIRYKNKRCTPNEIKKECIQKYNIKDWKSQPYYVMLVENDLCYVPQCAITSTCENG